MSNLHLSIRSLHASETSHRTGLIVGIICGVLAITLGLTIHLCRKDRVRHADPEAMRIEQRRVNGGWWGQEASPSETAVERRERMAREARVSRGRGRGFESGVEREARREREAREGGICPPVYQLPTPESRQQYMSQSQAPTTARTHEIDAPPAYNSTAVWGTNESQMAAQIVAAAQSDLNAGRG